MVFDRALRHGLSAFRSLRGAVKVRRDGFWTLLEADLEDQASELAASPAAQVETIYYILGQNFDVRTVRKDAYLVDLEKC